MRPTVCTVIAELNPVGGAVNVALEEMSPKAISESPGVEEPSAKVGVVPVPVFELAATPDNVAEVSPVSSTTWIPT